MPAEPKSTGSCASTRSNPFLALICAIWARTAVCQSVGVYPGFSDAALEETLDPDIKQGPAGDWNQTFRDRIGQGAQSRSQPCCQQERLDTSCTIRHRARIRWGLNTG